MSTHTSADHTIMASSPSSSTGRLNSSTIESSVTRLLVSTKHLLESLTQWARREVDDKFVSDAYVKLGNDFRAASRAFTNSGVDISDIGDVPKALRIVLESALSEPPTQESLDRFLPNIRNIIVNLLQNLKSKQIKLKDSLDRPKSLTTPETTNPEDGESKPSRTQGLLSRHFDSLKTSKTPQESKKKDHSLSSRSIETSDPSAALPDHAKITDTKDALSQLQKGNVMLRRASKRFSAYQFAKLTSIANANSQLPFIANEDTSLQSKNVSTDIPREDVHLQIKNPLTIFLRVGEKTKKVSLEKPITMASLRLTFVEKFAYSPGNAIFPDIYVQDPSTSVSFELEEQHLDTEIKDGVLLSLKEESPEKREINALDYKLADLYDRITQHFESTSNKIMESTATDKQDRQPSHEPEMKSKGDYSYKELIELEREIRALKQLQNSRSNSVASTLRRFLDRFEDLKSASFEENSSSNRYYIDTSYSKLSGDSDSLLTKVDDLLDMLEALRKDVAQRGVRIDAKHLKNTHLEIKDAKSSLTMLEQYIEKERPTWKKIWEAELDKVCEEQQYLTLQDDLMRDLAEDIKKIEETFDLIEQCSTQQSKRGSYKRADIATRLTAVNPTGGLHYLKDALLSEVAALNPDHKTRLEAIEKAERLRSKEREHLNPDEFEEELGEFVDKSMLKKSGGVEELERERRRKDEENLKSAFGIV